MKNPIVFRLVQADDWRDIEKIERRHYGDTGFSTYFIRMIPTFFRTTSWIATDMESPGQPSVGYAVGGLEDHSPNVGW